MDQYGTYDAVELANLVRRGQVTPAELVAEAIRRIEAHDHLLNAVVEPRFEAAMSAARDAPRGGPFAGVPFLLKATAVVAGEPASYAVKAFRGTARPATRDAAVVRRFREAGLVSLGFTNSPELGGSGTTEPLRYRATSNPWRPGYSPGGSSGGSAAAVAAGYVPAAHGEDSGGSIRIPASFCGVVGLKPSRGRVPAGPMQEEITFGLGTAGVITRSVRDAAALLDAISGVEPGDPYGPLHVPEQPFAAFVDTPPRPLRVGVLSRLPELSTDDECAAAVDAVGRVLEQLGHHVEAAWPAALSATLAARRALLILIGVEAATIMESMGSRDGLPSRLDCLEPATRGLVELGLRTTAGELARTRIWLGGLRRSITSWWDADEWDVLVTPVTAIKPPPLGYLACGDPDVERRRAFSAFLYTHMFNISGQPAISLPTSWTADGLPIGVQVVAAPGREDVLLCVAGALERASPWIHRRPALERRPTVRHPTAS